jgi:hypothetical protein
LAAAVALAVEPDIVQVVSAAADTAPVGSAAAVSAVEQAIIRVERASAQADSVPAERDAVLVDPVSLDAAAVVSTQVTRDPAAVASARAERDAVQAERADGEVAALAVKVPTAIVFHLLTAINSTASWGCPPTRGYRMAIPLARITARVLKEPPSERRLRIATRLKRPAVKVPPQAPQRRTETTRITPAVKVPPQVPRQRIGTIRITQAHKGLRQESQRPIAIHLSTLALKVQRPALRWPTATIRDTREHKEP